MGQIYKEAMEYAMEQIHNEYISKNNEDEFKMWFNMKYVEDTIEKITVSVASGFMQQMMTSKGCFEILQNKVREITGQHELEIICTIKPEKISNEPEIEAEEKTNPSKESESDSETVIEENNDNQTPKYNFKKHPLLNEEFNFDTFIPGENSEFAYKAAIEVAKNPGKKFNPLLLYGGSGLGKTHLMQAIGNYINNNSDNLKIRYVTSETFLNEFTSSLASKKPNEFKDRYRNLDVLLLDDIHFLNGKEGLQEELFNTFNALYAKKALMVFTCDRPIKEIKNMKNRLVSRLANGLSVDLQPPNYETRVAILQKKQELMGTEFDSEIIDYIAKNIETNVRELENALNKIIGYSELIDKKLTLDIVKNILRDVLSSNSTDNISIETIQKVIANDFQVSVSDLKSKKRDKKYVIPRQIAIYIAREITEISYTELGMEFGGKDHTTIMHAYEKIAEQIKFDPSLNSKIQLYIREIKDYKK
ncbi:MAG: chromosomal replication initiator protein DnaA [Treponema sp.]|nr:chromosomal replication initiator protein DnaA [Treponema sp.]